MSLEISGMNELTNDLQRIAGVVDESSILENAAQPILEQMQLNASSNPKRISGALHNALATKTKKQKVTIGLHRSDWHNDTYYPAYVEHGHAGPHPAPAHPFVRPAFDARADEAYDTIREGLRKALE